MKCHLLEQQESGFYILRDDCFPKKNNPYSTTAILAINGHTAQTPAHKRVDANDED